MGLQCGAECCIVSLRSSNSECLETKLVFGSVFRWIMLPIAMRQVNVFGFFFPSPCVGALEEKATREFHILLRGMAYNIGFVKCHGKIKQHFFLFRACKNETTFVNTNGQATAREGQGNRNGATPRAGRGLVCN